MIYVNNKEKINDFVKSNSYYVITDFDATLTTGKSSSSMGIIPQYLGGKCLEQRKEIFNYYRPLELDYTIEAKEKQEIMKEWAIKSFTLLSKYTTKEVIEKSLDNPNMWLRDGVKEFLKEMSNKNVPVIVMSSGMGNIVKAFLEKEDCMFDNIKIVSNFFEFKNGKTCINMDKLMATSNKEYKRIPEEVRKEIEIKNKAILFGDLIEDIKMVNKEKLPDTLTVGFLDNNVEQNLEKYNKNFDIVLTEGENFNTVSSLLK